MERGDGGGRLGSGVMPDKSRLNVFTNA